MYLKQKKKRESSVNFCVMGKIQIKSDILNCLQDFAKMAKRHCFKGITCSRTDISLEYDKQN